MSVNKAVHKLNVALSHLHKAEASLKHAKAAGSKALATEKSARAKIATQEKTIVDSFQSGTLTPEQSATAAKQLFGLGQKDQQAVDAYKKASAHDKALVTKDQKAVKKDRKTALGDLHAAELHLGLKETNKDRKALGLKAVKHVIRPVIHNTVGGKVGKWIAEAQAVLKAHGVPLSKMNAHDINLIIQHESSGNPNAVNNWDSNAAAGHPSKGLMQTIGPTFNAYKLPGHGKILNPVDNIIAGVRYAISRYGSISNVPGVKDVHAGHAYVGY